MKSKKIWRTAFAVFALAALMGSCKDENMEIVGGCPIVESTSPTKLATNVPLDQVITVVFNKAMNPATITPAAFTLRGPDTGGGRIEGTTGTSEVAGKLTYDAAKHSMSFVPDTKLRSDTTYTGRVATTVKDLMGNALQTDYVWTFSTAKAVAPTVLSTDPADSAKNVVLNKTIEVIFSEVMDPSTVTPTTFTVKHGATAVVGTISYTDTMAIFTPTSPLTSGTLYTATITTGAKNVAGTPLASNHAWTFTTGTLAAPTVLSTDPASNATNVALDKIISATFSEAMDQSTITGTTFTLKQGATTVSGNVNYAGSTATFTPTSKLLSGNTYTATITIGAKNVASTPLGSNYVWTFTTKAPSGPAFVDLKTAGRFGIIAATAVSNNAGFSKINDLDVGISPGVRTGITGFPPAIIVNGASYASDDVAPVGTAAMLTQAKLDLTAAYLFAEGATTPAPATVAGDQGGKTLAPGIYKSNSTLLIQNGDLTLDAQGDVNAVWIFQIASGFTTVGGAGGNVILTGGAQAKNIFWQTGSSATIGDNTSFKGNILALTSITMNSGAKVVGRMLVQNGAVVLTDTNIIDKP